VTNPCKPTPNKHYSNREIARLVQDYGHSVPDHAAAGKLAFEEVNWTLADAGNLARIAAACETFAVAGLALTLQEIKLHDELAGRLRGFESHCWKTELATAMAKFGACPGRLCARLRATFGRHPVFMFIHDNPNPGFQARTLLALRKFNETGRVKWPLYRPALVDAVDLYGTKKTRTEWTAWTKGKTP